MNQRIIVMLSVLLLSCGLMAPHAQTAEVPQIILKLISGFQAGNGTRIGQVIFVSHDGHSGFQEWCELGGTRDGRHDHYVLTGKQNARNQLRVRLTFKS